VHQGGNMWSSYEAYLTAMRDVIGLDLPAHRDYKNWEFLAKNSGPRWMNAKFCLVTEFPIVLKTDDQHRSHCEDGPSHLWKDGFAIYHWHGTTVPPEWIEDKSSLTAKTALTWPDIEQRRAACEILGWAKVLKELDAKVIDKDGDDEIGTLLEVTLPDSGVERFLHVKCGTGREFALPVPKDCGDTALAANAWTYGLTADDLKIEVRT
jgi:hypothetical protein